MSLRIYPFSVMESELRARCERAVPSDAAVAVDGARSIWQIDEDFEARIRRAAQADAMASPIDQGAELAAIIGLAIAGGHAERLSGEIDDWMDSVLGDFAKWATSRISREAASVFGVLVRGRSVTGQPGPGIGEPRYAMLTAEEAKLLYTALGTLVGSGGVEEAGDLGEFLLELLNWTEGCAREQTSFLLAIF